MSFLKICTKFILSHIKIEPTFKKFNGNITISLHIKIQFAKNSKRKVEIQIFISFEWLIKGM